MYAIRSYYVIRLALSEHDLAAASRQIDAVLEQAPRDYQGLIYKAELSLTRQQPGEAIEAYRQALDVRDTLLGRLGLARAYLADGQTEESETQLNEVLQKAPDNLPARYLKAVSATQRKDYLV